MKVSRNHRFHLNWNQSLTVSKGDFFTLYELKWKEEVQILEYTLTATIQPDGLVGLVWTDGLVIVTMIPVGFMMAPVFLATVVDSLLLC